MQKSKGFLIQSTARTLEVSPGPKQMLSSQAVLVEESIVKAFMAAIEQCPIGVEVISMTITEIPVWTKEGKNE